MATSSTTNYHFPYPLGSDSLSNVALRIQELAEYIDTTYTTLGINLSGSAALLQVGDAAGGALTGTYPNPTLDPSVPLPNGMRATTQAPSDNSTKVATTAYVDAYIAGTLPAGSVDTLELADGAVTNIKVNANAGISYSKLNLTGMIAIADLAFDPATQAELNAVAGDVASVSSTLSTHTAATTSVHGITNTANLVYTSDSRLSDQRVPTDGSVTNAKVAAGAAIAYSKLNLTGAILNADLAGSIAYSKLSLSGSITNADLAGSISPSKITGTAITAADTGTVTSTMIANGTIVDADVNASAAIAPSKISGTAVITTDSRLSDARTPTTHAATHVPGGSDVLDYTKIIGYGTSLPTWNATTHPAGVLWVVNTVGEPYSLYRSDGVSAWKQVGGGGASITVSDTAPSSPVAGAMWYDSTTGKTFIRYNDGSSSQWVEIGEASQLSVPTHGSSHVRGGSDIIDGDRVTIDYVPTRYTRNASASGAGDVTDLTAHLGGIDNNLSSLWVPPMLRIRKNALQNISSGSDTQLTWNVADINTDTMWTSGGDITVKTAGVYDLKAGVLWGANTTGRRVLYITLNGVGYNYHIAAYNWLSAGGVPGGTISTIYNLAVNDVLRVYVWQDSGATISVPNDTNTHHLNSTFFSAVLVGKTS